MLYFYQTNLSDFKKNLNWTSLKKHERNIQLRVANHGRCIINLPNVSLSDQNTSVMNALSKSKFEDLCLKTTLQEIFNLKT